MKNKTINLYTFEELTPEQQEKVIAKYRNINVEDWPWYANLFDDIKAELEQAGFEDVEIEFTGFYSQGDGASFTAKVNLDTYLKNTKKYTYLQKYLDSGAIELIIGIERTNHRYSHENTCSVREELYTYDLPVTAKDKIYEQVDQLTKELESYRYDLSKDIYRRLEKEYERLTSDDSVADTLKVNEYHFNSETLKIEQ